MRKLLAFFILVFILECGERNVLAQEEPKLTVGIKTYDNENVMVMTGHCLYSFLPLVFTPDEKENISYSISTDEGNSWGGYTDLAEESLTLYPDDTTSRSGRWLIRFKQAKEGSEVFSDVYSICFDCKAPSVTLSDPEKISGWLKSEDTITLDISDNAGISRVISKCGDDIIGNIREKEGEIVTSCTLELPLSDTGKKENTVETICYDLAGNSSVMTFNYLYDDKVPTLSVNAPEEGSVSASGTGFSVSASDGDGDALISYVLERKTGDEIITKVANDLVNEAAMDITEDGRYTLSVCSYDRADNRSEEITRHFTIDTNAPVLDVQGVPASADIREAARVRFDVSDECYEDTEVDIKLTRTAMGQTDIIPIEPYRLQGLPDTREVYINSDGEYELSVLATDGAGNESRLFKKFRIDTNAPDISISGISEGVATSFKPVVRFCAGEMFYESAIMTSILEKKEKTGSRLISKDEHVMKNVHDHTDIRVGSEGEYTLTCIAADRSGNRTEKKISFTVDYTPPVITGMSDIDGSFFKSFSLPKKIRELVSDETFVVANAYVNDIPYRDGQSIVREGKYVLTIQAKDGAENESEDSAVFIVDHTSPQIVLEGFDKNGNIQKGGNIKVGLFDCADHLLSVKLDGEDIPVSGGTADLTVTDRGSHCLSVKAEDDAGNVTDTDIRTMCYMSSPFPEGLIGGQKSISLSQKNDDSDADPVGLAVGMISVLSGSFGFVYRTFLRD